MSPASRSASAMSKMTRARPSTVPAETGKRTSAPAGKPSRRYDPATPSPSRRQHSRRGERLIRPERVFALADELVIHLVRAHRGGNRDWQQTLRRDQLLESFSYFTNGRFGSHAFRTGGESSATWRRRPGRRAIPMTCCTCCATARRRRCNCFKPPRDRRMACGLMARTRAIHGMSSGVSS
jgi:hypothetical protein